MAEKSTPRFTDSTVTRTPVETVLAFIDQYNAADSDGMWRLMSPDFARIGTSQWGHMGRDGYRDMTERWNRGFDETNWELIDIVTQGESVVCEFIESGVLARPWPITDDRVVQPNNKRYIGRAIVWFTVNAAGLIHTYRYYTNNGFEAAYGEEIAASGSDELITPANPV